MKISVEPENRLACVTFKLMPFLVTARIYKTGYPSSKLLDESMFSVFFGLTVGTYSPFYETLNEIVFDLMSGGILDFTHKCHSKFKDKRTKFNVEEIGPQILTMDHLDVCFFNYHNFSNFSICSIFD